MQYKRHLSIILLCASIVGVAQAQGKPGAVSYYRYIDNNGQVVISRQGVPNEFIANGYEVLSENGRVVRKVAPAPTAQELQQLKLKQQQEAEDRRLLRLYTIPDDVDRARNSKLVEVDNVINIYNTEIFELTTQRSDLLSKAANMERTGREVPQDILDSITALESQEQQIQEKIALAEQDKQQISKSFEQDKQRLLFLLQKK